MKIKYIFKIGIAASLYLSYAKANIVEHIPVEETKVKKNYYIHTCNKEDVYVFDNYEEYTKFFLMYLNKVDSDIIDLAIFTRGKHGTIIALKGLCEQIIVRIRVADFYNSITKDQIDMIHSKNMLTPLEAVQLWETLNLCVSGPTAGIIHCNCEFFNLDCHECLREYASHKLEHDNMQDYMESKNIKLP